MMTLSGSHHARYRAVSVPIGLEVAVNREPRSSERPRAVRGGVGRATQGRSLGVPSLYQDAAAV
jgi:hypothetical protein